MARVDARRTNLAVLALVLASAITGFSTFLAGAPSASVLFFFHGALGFSLLVLLWWKWKVITRGLRARWPGITSWLSIITLAILVAIIVSGIVSAMARGGKLGPWGLLEIHVGGALIIIPLFAAHLVGRWVPPAKRDLSRRILLRAGALTVAGVALRGLTEGVTRVAGLAGAKRRFTGSHLIGAPGESFPAVSWLFDKPHPIEVSSYTLRVGGLVDTPATLTYDDLGREEQHRVRATIDCTGGWYSAQDWEGVSVGALLDRAGMRSGVKSVVFTSVTGYSRAYPVAEARTLVLALRVADTTLEHDHGFPARVVAPGRRGYWWVKWVKEIEASASPTWLQPPVPLQ
jgi:DMSO/TMAO reductase YedYZ molybdopterin-dependent catalytic subunit